MPVSECTISPGLGIALRNGYLQGRCHQRSLHIPCRSPAHDPVQMQVQHCSQIQPAITRANTVMSQTQARSGSVCSNCRSSIQVFADLADAQSLGVDHLNHLELEARVKSSSGFLIFHVLRHSGLKKPIVVSV